MLSTDDGSTGKPGDWTVTFRQMYLNNIHSRFNCPPPNTHAHTSETPIALLIAILFAITVSDLNQDKSFMFVYCLCVSVRFCTLCE